MCRSDDPDTAESRGLTRLSQTSAARSGISPDRPPLLLEGNAEVGWRSGLRREIVQNADAQGAAPQGPVSRPRLTPHSVCRPTRAGHKRKDPGAGLVGSAGGGHGIPTPHFLQTHFFTGLGFPPRTRTIKTKPSDEATASELERAATGVGRVRRAPVSAARPRSPGATGRELGAGCSTPRAARTLERARTSRLSGVPRADGRKPRKTRRVGQHWNWTDRDSSQRAWGPHQ